MNALWITLTLLTAGFVGWPVTALVFRLARTIDDRQTPVPEPPTRRTTPRRTSPLTRLPACGAASTAAGTRRAASAAGAAALSVSSVRILRGGAIIGVLERLAVCLAILAGEPVAIAYVVAIKGLGRFAELKETPVAAERFIIGTLTSLLWAAGVAALAKVLFLG